MVAQQRQAAFTLGVVIFVLITFSVLTASIGPVRAQGAFGGMAVLALGPLVYRSAKGGVLSDERDRAIHLRSIQIAGLLFGVVATAALWITYYLRHQAGVISVELLPLAAWWGWVVFAFTQAVAILVLYRVA